MISSEIWLYHIFSLNIILIKFYNPAMKGELILNQQSLLIE